MAILSLQEAPGQSENVSQGEGNAQKSEGQAVGLAGASGCQRMGRFVAISRTAEMTPAARFGGCCRQRIRLRPCGARIVLVWAVLRLKPQATCLRPSRGFEPGRVYAGGRPGRAEG